MKAGTGDWQYVLVWAPGTLSSEFLWIAQSTRGRRHVWDSLAGAPFEGTPTPQVVLGELYIGLNEFMERSTHQL